MCARLAFYLILKPPDWAVAQGYHGFKGERYDIDDPYKCNEMPKRARKVKISLKLDSWKLEFKKNVPEGGQVVMVSSRSFQCYLPFGNALYKREHSSFWSHHHACGDRVNQKTFRSGTQNLLF